MAANRLRDALLAMSPALERAIGDTLVSVSGLRAELAKWPTPSALRADGKVRGPRCDRETFQERTAAKLADQIWAALAAQTVTVVAEATWGETIGDLAGDLDRIIDRRERLEPDIGAAFLEHPLGTVLNSMCGFGPSTAIGPHQQHPDGHEAATTASATPCSSPRSSPANTTPTNHPRYNTKPPNTYTPSGLTTRQGHHPPTRHLNMSLGTTAPPNRGGTRHPRP